MKSMLIIFLMTILRIGVPTTILLIIGETAKRYQRNASHLRGA
jgi:hypothetical protein